METIETKDRENSAASDDQDPVEPEIKNRLVCVRFTTLPTPYIFDSNNIDLKAGELVIVNTESGMAVAKVLGYTTEEDAAGLNDIKPILRKLTDEDRSKYKQIQSNEKGYHAFCRERIIARALPMKLTKVEQSFDGNKITFYFVAEGRVDFRELLKDLVEKYRTRIELRQIGSRQEAGMLGGIGSCGRELCCAMYLTSFQRISVKMAKNQNMTLNPTKISGLCGKLKCCLAYEKESYANLIENLPKPGKTVYLEQGEVTVVSINVINQSFVAKHADRHFLKAKVSDIITKEEFIQLSEEKANENNKAKKAARDKLQAAQATSQDEKPKKKRNRGPRRKRRKSS